MKEVFTAEIIDYGYDGEGVARLDGKVAFLPYTIKGEVGEFEKIDEKSKFIKGKLCKIVKASHDRKPAPCPYFESCGGCAYQHMTYEKELEIKAGLLRNQLKKIGYCGDIEIKRSPKEYGYRNKIRLFVGEKGLALKEKSSNRLVYIDKCLLVLNRINDAIEKINNFIKSQHLEHFYNEVVLRQEDEKILVNFIIKEEKNVNYQGLYLLIGDCGIFETFKGNVCHKIGLRTLKTKEFELDCEFSPNSFHQVNEYLTKGLYEGVLQNIVGNQVVNCYSGAGVLSAVIARQGKSVVGIELGEAEHYDAEKLRAINRLENLTNVCGDCAEVLPQIDAVAETVIVDPPRAGLADEVCDAINVCNCRRLIYVSCNSATLVRDIAKLSGYSLEKVFLYDMFARTGEYEVLCIMNRCK